LGVAAVRPGVKGNTPPAAYLRSMAELERWIMRDSSEESLDELFEEITAATD
jgi:hypothetical protein